MSDSSHDAYLRTHEALVENHEACQRFQEEFYPQARRIALEMNGRRYEINQAKRKALSPFVKKEAELKEELAQLDRLREEARLSGRSFSAPETVSIYDKLVENHVEGKRVCEEIENKALLEEEFGIKPPSCI